MSERHESLWARCRRQREHPGDDALLEVMLARRDDVVPATRAAGHAATCAPCGAAVSRLEAEWDVVGSAARAAADELIGPDRLARQLDIIERRLDGQPGRVLRFPIRARVARPQPRARRWVAVAAACGLFFGLAAGRLLGPVPSASTTRAAWTSPTARPDAVRPPVEPAVADEHLLGEVDAALARAVHYEFEVLDELTPRSGDVFGPSGRRR